MGHPLLAQASSILLIFYEELDRSVGAIFCETTSCLKESYITLLSQLTDIILLKIVLQVHKTKPSCCQAVANQLFLI